MKNPEKNHHAATRIQTAGVKIIVHAAFTVCPAGEDAPGNYCFCLH